MLTHMKIAILGAGALGCYYGAMFAHAGMDVRFIMRSGYEQARREGIHIDSDAGSIDLPEPTICASSEDCGPVDLVLVCWKSSANPALATALPPLLHEQTDVMTLQNGMGNAEAIAEYVDAQRVYLGLCFIRCMSTVAGHVIHRGGNSIQVAPLLAREDSYARAQHYSEIFNKSGIVTRAFLQIEEILWRKLSWNIPFNGLCLAHGGISIEQLFAMPDQVERARRIVQEVVDSAALCGHPLGDKLVDLQMTQTAPMGAFIPSSAMDYIHGRPIEYQNIWGIPLQKALAAGASVPTWEQLTRDILARMEESS